MTEEDYPGAGRNRLVESVAGHHQLTFEFLEVRLWELDPEPVLAAGDPALLPLVPLMGRPSEDVLRRAVALAGSVPDEEERADIYTGIWVLGGLRYSRDLLRSMIRSEQMSRSVTYDEIVEEGVLKGTLRARRDDIVEALQERVGSVPREIRDRLNGVEDGDLLSRLLRLAVRSNTLDEFLSNMEPASPR